MSQPDWMNQENDRANKGKGATTANPKAPRLVKEAKKQTPKVERALKGFRVSKTLISKFDVLVAEQKTKSGKNGPALIDEALELLFAKYKKG